MWLGVNYRNKRAHVCACVGGGAFSATFWAYPEDLFCFKKRKERSDKNRVCRTHLCRHTSQDCVSFTYRWVNEDPWPKITPITNFLVMMNARCSPDSWSFTASHLNIMFLCVKEASRRRHKESRETSVWTFYNTKLLFIKLCCRGVN